MNLYPYPIARYRLRGYWDIDVRGPVIYQITNLLDGKVYIGKTADLRARCSDHLTESRRNSPRTAIARAILAFGEGSFSVEVLQIPEYSEMDTMEAYEIFAKRSIDPARGYNWKLGQRPMWKDRNGVRLWQLDLDDFAELLAKSFTPEWKPSRR